MKSEQKESRSTEQQSAPSIPTTSDASATRRPRPAFKDVHFLVFTWARSFFSIRSHLVFLLLLPLFALAQQPLSSEEKEIIRKGLLAHLGLSGQPVWASNAPSTVPDYMHELFAEAGREMLDADAVRYYYPQEILDTNSGLLLSFNLSASVRAEDPSRMRVRRVTLRLRLSGCGRVAVTCADTFKTQRERLLDWRSFNESSPCPQSSTPSPIETFPYRTTTNTIPTSLTLPDHNRQNEWIDFDVTSAIESIRADLMTLSVNMSSSTRLVPSQPHSPSSIVHSRRESVALVVFYEDVIQNQTTSKHEQPKRIRRDASSPAPSSTTKPKGRGRGRKKGRKKGAHSRQPHKKLCQLVNLHVDFKELNWDDWILSPASYDAFMCMGECPNPMPDRLNATNHAIVQSLINSLNPSVSAPCCVPTELAPLHILYKDINNQIVLKSYPDMKVTACGCR